jgi:hypothetical protein
LDDLHELGRILNKDKDKGAEIDRSLSWQNAMFFKGDTNEFADIICHYRAIIDSVAKASLPEAGQNLLAVMKNDPEQYFRMLCPNNYQESIYYNVPVLAAIKSKDFVEQVLKLTPNSQETVFAAFRGRYDYGPPPSRTPWRMRENGCWKLSTASRTKRRHLDYCRSFAFSVPSDANLTPSWRRKIE